MPKHKPAPSKPLDANARRARIRSAVACAGGRGAALCPCSVLLAARVYCVSIPAGPAPPRPGPLETDDGCRAALTSKKKKAYIRHRATGAPTSVANSGLPQGRATKRPDDQPESSDSQTASQSPYALIYTRAPKGAGPRVTLNTGVRGQ
jgi:hypothetical protein